MNNGPTNERKTLIGSCHFQNTVRYGYNYGISSLVLVKVTAIL